MSREIWEHHLRWSDKEVIIFRNHPRTGSEPDWFYLLKSLIGDQPVASAADREILRRFSFSPVGILRHLLGSGRILLYLGESGYVRQIRLPNLLTA